MIIIKPSVEIEEIDGIAMLKRIEKAGRTCYKSEKNITEDSAKSFVKNLIKNGHESVIEHEKITSTIICDRGVSMEIIRHRIASYSQESTRYVDYKSTEGSMQFIDIEPFMNTAALSVWVETMTYIENAYNKLRKLGMTPQIARSVLPNSLKTEIVMTMNLREWRHFFKLRTAPAAHPQMREIAAPLLSEFKRLIPIVFDDL